MAAGPYVMHLTLQHFFDAERVNFHAFVGWMVVLANLINSAGSALYLMFVVRLSGSALPGAAWHRKLRATAGAAGEEVPGLCRHDLPGAPRHGVPAERDAPEHLLVSSPPQHARQCARARQRRPGGPTCAGGGSTWAAWWSRPPWGSGSACSGSCRTSRWGKVPPAAHPPAVPLQPTGGLLQPACPALRAQT